MSLVFRALRQAPFIVLGSKVVNYHIGCCGIFGRCRFTTSSIGSSGNGGRLGYHVPSMYSALVSVNIALIFDQIKQHS